MGLIDNNLIAKKRSRVFEVYTDNQFDPVVIVDISRAIRYYNDAFLKFVKLPPRKLKIGTLIEQITPCGFLCDRNFNQCTSEREMVSSQETTIMFPGGDYEALIRLVPILSSGLVLEILVVYHDVTDEVRLHKKYKEQLKSIQEAQAQLLHTDRLSTLGEISAEVAHELKNPLSRIVGFADIAKSKLKEGNLVPAELLDAIEEIQIGAENANQIVKDIQNFSQKDDERKEIRDFSEIIKKSISLMKPTLKAKGIEIEVQAEEKKFFIFGNGPKLEQVLMNIFTNAVQAIAENKLRKERGKIWLRVSGDPIENAVQVSVRDNGCGVSEETAKNAFLPFYTTKKIGEGSGLGLSIVNKIIEWHRGSIKIERLEAGMEMQVTLPMAKE